MKKRKMSRSTQLLLTVGLLLSTLIMNFRKDLPSIPDFVLGSIQGFGIGLMLVGLVKQVREKRSACARNVMQGEDNSVS